ncbi:hypothetical protein CYLTODRAFT_240254 [Cylindrobasidium torrendii FP15055 ss-10]|uniref:Uncharacterized protein n=1 Tax=Cylindrobasidium torrendii FP15055 ss-10 TaxID=1314674 RepID=A0A0D7BTB2_9AGAR|nr:hypothetical protein CYLTODRAFT_240254 [Cylindrobasidium torrendii FP15055 ss-10]
MEVQEGPRRKNHCWRRLDFDVQKFTPMSTHDSNSLCLLYLCHISSFVRIPTLYNILLLYCAFMYLLDLLNTHAVHCWRRRDRRPSLLNFAEGRGTLT